MHAGVVIILHGYMGIQFGQNVRDQFVTLNTGFHGKPSLKPFISKGRLVLPLLKFGGSYEDFCKGVVKKRYRDAQCITQQWLVWDDTLRVDAHNRTSDDVELLPEKNGFFIDLHPDLFHVICTEHSNTRQKLMALIQAGGTRQDIDNYANDILTGMGTPLVWYTLAEVRKMIDESVDVPELTLEDLIVKDDNVQGQIEVIKPSDQEITTSPDQKNYYNVDEHQWTTKYPKNNRELPQNSTCPPVISKFILVYNSSTLGTVLIDGFSSEDSAKNWRIKNPVVFGELVFNHGLSDIDISRCHVKAKKSDPFGLANNEWQISYDKTGIGVITLTPSEVLHNLESRRSDGITIIHHQFIDGALDTLRNHCGLVKTLINFARVIPFEFEPEDESDSSKVVMQHIVFLQTDLYGTLFIDGFSSYDEIRSWSGKMLGKTAHYSSVPIMTDKVFVTLKETSVETPVSISWCVDEKDRTVRLCLNAVGATNVFHFIPKIKLTNGIKIIDKKVFKDIPIDNMSSLVMSDVIEQNSRIVPFEFLSENHNIKEH